tara:strand:- start:239 stop:940 length:702 start_codon:yes stop_codon:yes gene_type:complete
LAEAHVEAWAVFVVRAIGAPNAKALEAHPEVDVQLLLTGLAVRFEASFVSAFLVATRTSPAYIEEEAFSAKPLAAAVAIPKFEDIIIRPLFAFETNEFATPVAETALLGAGAAESTRAGVADFHLRGGNDEFTFAPPEVKVGFVLDTNHRGHALFALFEVKNVVLVGREANVERLQGGLLGGEYLQPRHVAPGEVQVSQTFVFGTSRHTDRVHETDDPSAVHAGAVREFEAFE